MQNGLKRMFSMKEKKTLVLKENYFETFQYFMKISGKFITDTLAKISQNIFAYFSISEHSASSSLFQKKIHLFWFGPGGLPPPPFKDCWPVTYIYFFTPSLTYCYINFFLALCEVLCLHFVDNLSIFLNGLKLHMRN